MQTMHKPIESIKSALLARVALGDLVEVWPRVKPWINEAMEGSRYSSTNDVFKAVLSDHAQLWIVWDGVEPSAVIVTQLNNCSKGKYCSIWICVGSGREGSQYLILELEQWAKSQGCTFMRNEARAGWSRVLKAYGYSMPHVILEKDL